MTAPGAAAPSSTIGEVLAATAQAGRGVITFHLDGGAEPWSVARLYERALGHVAELQALGVAPGDRVGLLGHNRPEWAAWAYATWMSGATLVPLPCPPRVRDRAAFALQIAGLVHATHCGVVVAAPGSLAAVPDDVTAVSWDVEGAGRPDLPAVDPDSLALVQASSGTTGTPKGIGLTHANVVLRGRVAVAAERSDRPPAQLLAWLPFFHMSGVTALLHSAQEHQSYHVLPAERFARDPGLWMRLVGEVRATITGAPSSGWASAMRAIERHPEGIDLSSLELALFSMEMVDAEVMDRVVQVGGRFGLRPEIIAISYGLTESGGGGSFSVPGKLRIDTIDLERFTDDGVAVPVPDGSDRPVKRVVSCGSPKGAARVELRVGTPDRAYDDREVGEVLLRGGGLDSVRMVAGELDRDGVWLRTGDIGYVADGELFITGRSKELIIVKGRNYHPEDIEWAAARAAGAPSAEYVAFATSADIDAEVVVLVETATPLSDEVAAAIRASVANTVGVVVRRAIAVAPGRVPRAANGKLQRVAARQAYVAGTLGGEP